MSVEDGAGDLDDEVKDYSKLFKDYGHHDDKDDDMMDDRLDTVQVYNEEGTPMISIMNTPMIASRTSSPDSLTSDCDGEDGNRYTGNCSSSSRVSDSSIGRILGKVSPSDLPASPGDLYDERNPHEHDGNNNNNHNNHESGHNQMPNNMSLMNVSQHDRRSSQNNFQPLPSPRKTIVGSLLSRKPLPNLPLHQPRSRESADYGNFNIDEEFPPPLPSSSPPALCSPPSQLASVSSLSSKTIPPAVPYRPNRPPVPPKPSHLKTVNENGNSFMSSCSSSSRVSDSSSSRIMGQVSPLGSLISPLDNSASTESSSSDDDDDDDDLLADVIYAGIPKRKKREQIPSPQSKISSTSSLTKISLTKVPSVHSPSNKSNDDQGDYLETDIDSIINYEKFLNNQRLTTFEPFEHQV